VVLATNVAETSLTVPGISYVVDPGTARISRYSHRTKVQRLPIEAVSQASANQRAGRCGRLADGICIRLYSQEDYLARPEFTEPEILRTSLASVILRLASLGLGDVADFPFVEPPDRRSVADGVQLLEELGALAPGERDPRKRLTPLGRRLAQLPVDPRLGRMILEADRLGCVREVMVIAAALSIQDPRERPGEHQEAADAAHRRFVDPTSDFLTYLNLWNHLRDQQKTSSSSRFRRMCKSEYLNYLRIREWQDLVAQLRQVAAGVGVHTGTAQADPVKIHQSLLAGLLSHIGVKDTTAGPRRGEYLGARGARFAVFPGSALFKKPPDWVMAAELVQTSRLWGRVVAKIEPEWIEEIAAHLVKRTYSEPHWEKRRAAVVAVEKVLLYGVPIVAARTIGYGRIDPQLSRELFVRHALVEGDWQTHHRFFALNRRLLDDVEELENRARRRDLLVDDETLFAFYDDRIPADVVSGRHFDAWWKRARHQDPELLTLTEDLLVADGAETVSEGDYPVVWQAGDLALRLSYQFEPGADADGVTAHAPVTALNRLDAEDFRWQIPGLRLELLTALIRSLPKSLRVNFVPAPDHARAVLSRLRPRTEPLTTALSRELAAMTGTVVPPDAWDWAKVPDHLTVTFRIEDEGGRALAEGKDLEDLRIRLRPTVRAAVADAAGSGLERAGLTSWTLGALPRQVERARSGVLVRGYPALVEEDGAVAVRVLPSPAEQERAMRVGTRRLLLLGVPAPAKGVLSRLDTTTKLVLAAAPHAGASALFEDCTACAVDAIVEAEGGPAWDGAGFARLLAATRAALPGALLAVVTDVARVLAAWQDVDRRLRATTSPSLHDSVHDVRDQVGRLVYPGFVAVTGRRRLTDLVRYLRAADRRLEVLADRPDRDRRLLAQVRRVQDDYSDLLARYRPGTQVPAEVLDLRWMLEEFRISLFAQTVGTAYPVSEKRILQAMADAAP
jgi:ATP-dependent helicase HrpA